MKNYKKITSLAIASLMVASTSIGFAAPRDVYNVNGTKFKTAAEMGLSKTLRGQVALMPNNYLFEGNDGKLYKLADVNAAYAKDQANFLTVLKAEYPAVGDVNASELKVESVSAINGAQVEVKFNKSVDKASVFTSGLNNSAIKTANLAFTGIDGTAPTAPIGNLSEDGKTLVITANDNSYEQRVKVVIDNLKATDGKDIVKYDQIINFGKDNVAPTILGTEKLSATTVKVKFSEPIKALNTAGTSVTFKDADGNVIAGSGNGVTSSALANNDTEVTFTLGSVVPANKVITATFVGVQDKAGNVQTPNPATVNFQKGEQDAVGAKVSAITQTGAKTFTIKFDKPVQTPAPADITVGGTDTTGTVKAIGTDSTTFEFTAATALDGASTVATGSGKVITDLSGKTSTFSQVVNFVKDEVAPKVTSTQVIKDATDGKEYLEITFDKNVNLDGTPADSTVTGNGTYTKEYVTSASATFGPTTVTYKDVANKKVVRVELDTFLGTTTDVEGAKYNLDLTFTKLTGDTNVVAAKAENVTFTRGKDGTAVTNDVAKVTGIAKVSGDNNKVTVTFDKAVEGASATNPANYKVDGAVVESVTLAAASGTQVATLNLKKDSNSFSGTRNVTVENVKTLSSGKVIERTVLPVVLDENVRPTVTKAQLTATDKITLTFSEIVSNADDTAGADFDLYVGNTKSAKTVAAEVVAVNSEKNTLVLTISADLTAAEITQGISIKPTANLNIKDAKANPLNIPASITITQ